MLSQRLIEEKSLDFKGSIYYKVQIELAYNSKHIEGSQLSHEQTRYIFETDTIGFEEGSSIRVDDIIEVSNHFTALDYLIDSFQDELTEKWMKDIHSILKRGTSDVRKSWFRVGDYKAIPNEVGGEQTSLPENVATDMASLIKQYHNLPMISIEDILDFHVQFERIHPFQDGNGRVGHLIMFKEYLKHNHVSFIISDDMKYFYYRSLSKWGTKMVSCLILVYLLKIDLRTIWNI